MRRNSSTRARFAGDEISAIVQGLPNDVFPTSRSRTCWLAEASRRKYSIDWSYVKSCESAPAGKPKTDAGVGTPCAFAVRDTRQAATTDKTAIERDIRIPRRLHTTNCKTAD